MLYLQQSIKTFPYFQYLKERITYQFNNCISHMISLNLNRSTQHNIYLCSCLYEEMKNKIISKESIFVL